MRDRWGSLLCLGFLTAAGCHGSSSAAPKTPATPPMAPGGMTPATSYAETSIPEMRQGKPGAYEIGNAVVIGVTPSSKSPRLFVQDPSGGDFSAMEVKCSTTSTSHPCADTTAATVHGLADGHLVDIKGTYIKKAGFEEFYLDEITDNGAGTMPASQPVMLADIQRSQMNVKWWFQHVTVQMTDTLNMFDWTPTEFVYSGTNACPKQFGWGMLPASVKGVSAGAACQGTTQPMSAVPSGLPPDAEVLIGTDFYKGFTYSTDCACAAMYKDIMPTPTMTLSGTLSGILIGTTPYMSTTVYQYLAPKMNSEAPLK
jgi:hypothetical protein